MADYMRERWYRRKQSAIDYLGGKCVRCGQTDNLNFDHIDPNTKSFTISKRTTASEAKFWNEINKCQLLCTQCHEDKTRQDNGQANAKMTHGTLSSYRYCRCDICKKGKSDYTKEKRRISMGI